MPDKKGNAFALMKKTKAKKSNQKELTYSIQKENIHRVF